jgi:hypothetical protein
MAKTYSEKLKDPRWQKKRLEILNRDEWACANCGNNTKTLHVHHRYYITGNEPWEYDSDVLVTLCEECHEAEEMAKDNQKVLVRTFQRAGFLNMEMDFHANLMGNIFDHFQKHEFEGLLARLLCNDEFRNEVKALYNKEVERLKNQSPNTHGTELPF